MGKWVKEHGLLLANIALFLIFFGGKWPVKRGGVILKLYEHSLSVLFLFLFLASMALHALGGVEDYNEEQASHGQPGVTFLGYLAVYLREKGSPESKPVAEPHYETGS